MTQLVVIIQILVSQSQAVNPLGDQLVRRVFNPRRISMVAQATRELADDAGEPFDPARQQSAAITADRAAIEFGPTFSIGW